MDKKKLLSDILSWMFLAVVAVLRTVTVTFDGLEGVLMEAGKLLIPWMLSIGAGLLWEKYRYHLWSLPDTEGSLIPAALTVTAVAVTTVLDCRSLLFPVGVLLLGIPMVFPGRTNTFLRDTVLTAAIILYFMPERRAEYFCCVVFYCVYISAKTANHYTTELQMVIRPVSAILLIGSVLILSGGGDPFCGGPLALALKAAGIVLLLFKSLLAPRSSCRPALQLLALALPAGNGLFFWSLVIFGQEREERESLLDDVGERIGCLPLDRGGAADALKMVANAVFLTEKSWRRLWQRFGRLIPYERQLELLHDLDRTQRGAELFAAFLEEMRPDSREIWEFYRYYEYMVPVRKRNRLRRIRKRCCARRDPYDRA